MSLSKNTIDARMASFMKKKPGNSLLVLESRLIDSIKNKTEYSTVESMIKGGMFWDKSAIVTPAQKTYYSNLAWELKKNKNVNVKVMLKAVAKELKAKGFTSQQAVAQKKNQNLNKFINQVKEVVRDSTCDPNIVKTDPTRKFSGYSWLHYAAKENLTHLVPTLLSMPNDFFSSKLAITKNKYDPLDIAFMNGSTQTAELLIDHLIALKKPKAVLDGVFNYIHSSEYDSNFVQNIFVKLKNAGLDITSYKEKETGMSFVHLFAKKLDSKNLDFVIKQNSHMPEFANNINYVDNERNPIFVLCKSAVTQLRQDQAYKLKNINSIAQNFDDCLKILVSNGANPNSRDFGGYHPVKYSLLLLSQKFNGKSLKIDNMAERILKSFQNNGLNFDSLDGDGQTIFHNTVQRSTLSEGGMWTVYKNLGLDIDMPNIHNQTALDLSYRKDDVKSFTEMIKQGADVQKIKCLDGNILTDVFHNAGDDIYKGFHTVLPEIVQQNIDLNAVDGLGRDALFLSIIDNNNPTFDFFVKRMQNNILKKDNTGQTALEIIVQRQSSINSALKEKLEVLKEKAVIMSDIILPTQTTRTASRTVRVL